MPDSSWLTYLILGAIVLIVLGILLRAALSSENPPAWLAFGTRRKATGAPTTWKKWEDDD